MATNRIILPVPGGVWPDGSGSGNDPMIPFRVVSSGTQTTNSCKVTYETLAAATTPDQMYMWQFTLPGDYASGGTVRLWFTNAGTSTNTVRWKSAAAIAVLGTTDMDAMVFDTVVGGDSTPNATTGIAVEFSVALTMTNAGTFRPIVVMIGRDTDHANDTNASSMNLVAAFFEYVV